MTQSPRPGLTALLRSSLHLFTNGLGELSAIVALGLMPGALLTTLALVSSGLTNAEAFAQVMAGGHLGKVGLVAAARLAGQFAAFLATLAILLSVEARQRGAPLGARKAFEEASGRLWPYFATIARAALYIAAGLLAFIAPGLLLGVLYVFAGPAVVVDGLSGPHALAKSRQLVAHDPIRVVLFMAAALALAAASAAAATWLIAGLLHLARPPMGLPAWQLLGYLERCAAGLAASWAAVFTILLYKDLSENAAGAQ